MWLFLLFVLVPIVEIALFIQVGGFIGLWPTLAIVVLTAIAGTILVRSQGLWALSRIQNSLQNLSDPTEALAHGAMILAAGLLLLTPGFFTDGIGFLLLIPPFRLAVFKYVRSRIKVQSFAHGHGYQQQQNPEPQGDVIDGEFSEIPEENLGSSPKGSSGWTRH